MTGDHVINTGSDIEYSQVVFIDSYKKRTVCSWNNLALFEDRAFLVVTVLSKLAGTKC